MLVEERKLKMQIINKIGFLINQADVIHHYLNIWEKLNADEFEIIVFGDEKRVSKFCEGKYQFKTYAQLLNEKIKYKYLVSHQFIGFVDGLEGKGYLLKRIGVINIRLMYALGKNKWHFAEWNNIYDIILCYGPYQIEKLNKYERPIKIAVGYPRYDKFFNNNLNKNIELTDLNCDAGKKTIVWLPTYSSLSSIDEFANTICELKARYNVIVKPHPGTMIQEPERVQLLEKLGFTKFISEPFDNLKLFLIADYIISDYGGTAFGAIYTDKNLILLNVNYNKFDANLESNSSDIELRELIPNFDSENSNLIDKLLVDENYWIEQKKVRNRLRSKYFKNNYGQSSDEVVRILNNLPQILNTKIDTNLKVDEQLKLSNAELLIEKEKYEDAEEILNDILDTNSKSVQALIDLSVIKILGEDYELAGKLLMNALSIEPENEIAIGNLNYIEERGFVNV